MPRTKSAKKAERSSARKQTKNRQQAAAIDKLVRAVKKTPEPTKEQMSLVQKALDKAAKTGLMHARTAARAKSRLLKQRSAPVITATKKSTAKRPKKKTIKK